MWFRAAAFLILSGLPVLAGVCENFERFKPGPASGQFGWVGEDPDHLTIVDASIRHDATMTPDWGQLLLVSPEFPPQAGLLEVELAIDGKKGEYVLGTLSNNGTQNIFVRFKSNGVIAVFRISQYLGAWTSTSGRWSAGTPLRLGIESIKGVGSNNWEIKVHKDGEVIYSGTDNATAVGSQVEGMTRFFVRRHREGGVVAGSITIDSVRLDCASTVEPVVKPE